MGLTGFREILFKTIMRPLIPQLFRYRTSEWALFLWADQSVQVFLLFFLINFLIKIQLSNVFLTVILFVLG